LYGTAWKEDETERLTRLALGAGFRGIDTANQRKHYHEAAVGAAIARAFAARMLSREELFVQTKFTSVDGQDHRLPYERDAEPAAQVRQSFASSLEHLGLEQLDAYVLHGPTTQSGLAPYDLAVWRAMEQLCDEQQTRLLGVSNMALDQLQALCKEARIQPAFVQNRCYARTGWDQGVRNFCRKHGIVYQGFSLLTANQKELQKPAFKQLVTELKRTPAQIVFRYAMQVGMLPLTGTSDADHMRQDLQSSDFSLTEAQLAILERIGRT